MDTRASLHEKTRRAHSLAAEEYRDLFHDKRKAKAFDRKLLDDLGKKFAAGTRNADAGCRPSAHVGRDVLDKGMRVVGIDVSDARLEISARCEPGMAFLCGDTDRRILAVGRKDTRP